MSNKLRNIKAVKELLAGEHKSQRKSSTYFGKTTKETPEEDILERFENGDPKVWIETKSNGTRIKVTKHDGFTSRVPENSIADQVRDILTVPDKCPKCNKDMRDHEQKLNFKLKKTVWSYQ